MQTGESMSQVFFSSATASVFLRLKHPVVHVAIIPCDMGSQGEGIGEKDRGWQLERGRETDPILVLHKGTTDSNPFISPFKRLKRWAGNPITITS